LKHNKENISRRSFLNKSAAMTFGFSVMPSYLALGKEDSEGNIPPSNRVNLACIGCGGQAGTDVRNLCNKGNAEPVAFCDVDFQRASMDKWKGLYPKAQTFSDFRIMLDKMDKDIDAVLVGTPDHTHFVAAMDSMRRGKHVYVEKPLTHTFREADLLMRAEKKYGVVTQMGNQGHTSTACAQFKKMTETGVIRDIVKIDAWKTPGLWFMNESQRKSFAEQNGGSDKYPPAQTIPESLNWDLWCGPSEVKPYNGKYHPFNWRAFHLYGTGMFGDWGAHIVDFAHDFLKLGLPSSLNVLEMIDHNKVIYPLTTKIHMHFPERSKALPAVDLFWREGGTCHPDVDEKYWHQNDEGEAKAPNLGGAGTLLHSKDGEFLVMRQSHSASSRLLPHVKSREYGEKMKVQGPKDGHHESFIQACMGNGKTWSPFSVSGKLTQTLIMGAACQYLNKDLDFDIKKERFKNNDEANALLDGPTPRKGYEEYYKNI
jgi:predicted dehydrogenase